MQRILVTSAIPYINGIKHLGNLIGSQLPADLYARYMRARGHEVMFICATDEHGTPAELAAAQQGIPVAQYCEQMHAIQKELSDGFRLSFDHFGRSSSQRNQDLTQHFAARLADNGYIVEVEEDQIYSVADERFLPDRYIQGECPACGYDRARGDQCENCTKQLDPADLIKPRSVLSGSADLELRKTKHLHLRQSAFRQQLSDWLDSRVGWPILTTSIARKWLDDGEGLQDRGITRDLAWGVPVRRDAKPWPGMEGKVFYVWFDAPIEYIAATAEWADASDRPDSDWHRWWRVDRGAQDVRYVQFMGKDNVPFHTLSFPATILGSGEDWKLVDYIKSFNFLNYDGGQFSTSLNRGIFMDEALEILPSDYWRWWLLSHAPEQSDSEFTWDNFTSTVNKDLADVLGNFVSRITKFCRSNFGEVVPECREWQSSDREFVERLGKLFADYQRSMDSIEIRKSAGFLRAIWASCNEYLQSEAPWQAVRSDRERAESITAIGLNLVRLNAILSAPFIPDASSRIMAMFTQTDSQWPECVETALRTLTAGSAFHVGDRLFEKVSDDDAEAWKKRFGGSG